MSETISVRVARLRGWTFSVAPCSVDGCRTPHWRDAHGLNARNSLPDYTSPEEAFALLAEMVEATAEGEDCPHEWWIELGRDSGGYWVQGSDRHSPEAGVILLETAPTLGEAIALAWLAWQEAKL